MGSARLVALQRSSQLPLWRQIEVDLIVDIQNGVYGPGDKLPAESALSERYAVNRHTVRMALASLAESRMVEAQQGRGVFVTRRQVEYLLTRDQRWSDLETQFDDPPTARVIGSYARPATRFLAQVLGVEEGQTLVTVESHRTLGSGASIYSYHTMEEERFRTVPEVYAATGNLTAALRACGVLTYFRATTWIDCRLPRPREAEALDIPLERPVVVMSYVTRSEDLAPVLYGHSVLPSEAIRLRIDDQHAPDPGRCDLQR